MAIIKNIVGKLWMTIIALVAFVLLILGLFLFRYIDTSFPKFNDQLDNLTKLAFKISSEAPLQEQDNAFVRAMNDLLTAQDIGMLTVQAGKEERSTQPKDKLIRVTDVLTPMERERIFRGDILNKRFSAVMPRGETEFVAIAVPVTDAKKAEIIGAIVLYQPLKSSEGLQLYVKKLFAFVSFIGFLLTTFFAFFLITRITRPLLRLKEAAGQITHGEYSTRVPVMSSDEIGELAGAFNLMGEQLEETIKDLNLEKDNLSSVLGSMSDAVFSFDLKGRIIFMNPYGEKLLKEWSEIQWSDPDPDPDPDLPLHKVNIPEPLQMLFEDVVEQTKALYSKIHVHNGVWSIVMAPLYSHKQVRGAVAVLRDVTEEHKLEKLRKDFVANVSHELRTPLSMLQGYSEALLDDIAASPEERQDLAQIIHDESLRMGRLVKDLLDLARMEAGHMEMNMDEVYMTALFRRVHRKFSALCKDREIKLVMEAPEEQVILEQADQDRLEQVLTNLLDNAIRHTPARNTIYMRLQPFDQTAVLVEIEDEGKGIPPEDLPYIFERFYKADKARTRAVTGGTGLGLAIVKNIIEAHRGSVNVRSAVGHGTTFSIILPVQKQP